MCPLPRPALSQKETLREHSFGCIRSRVPPLLPADSRDQAAVGYTAGSSTQREAAELPWDSGDFLTLELFGVAILRGAFGLQPGAFSSPPQGMCKCTTVTHTIMCGLPMFARAAIFLLLFLV